MQVLTLQTKNMLLLNHLRYGHASPPHLQNADLGRENINFCPSCKAEKHAARPTNELVDTTKTMTLVRRRQMDKFHADTIGLLKRSRNNQRFVLTV